MFRPLFCPGAQRAAGTGFWCSALFLAVAGCGPDYRPCWLGGNCGDTGTQVAGSVFQNAANSGQAFSEVLLESATFGAPQVVTTVSYKAGDLARRPRMVDFNHDGRVDPVVGYAQQQRGVIQILLSYGPTGSTQFFSLTLDGGENSWNKLMDVAVGDIDGDGNQDLVAATADGIVYMHHPSDPNRTHVLSEWGAPTGAAELINGTNQKITNDELTAILAQALGPGTNLDNYIVTVDQGYTSVEIGDFDHDGYNDIVGSRRLRVDLKPKADAPVQPITIVAGSLQLLINPGGATTGADWNGVVIGQHERHNTMDREGARQLRAIDVDGDGDLDLISIAADDQNVQVAWFENPSKGGRIDPETPWPQHRIGSILNPTSFDVADVTGDGRADVIVASPDQKQVILFVQPDSVADRGYDWFSVPIITFDNYKPLAVRAIDVDNDGVLEIVVGCDNGALRYFKSPLMPTDPWVAVQITDFNPTGDIGRFGYGDFDGDGDADLIIPISGSDPLANRVVWVRNELIPTLPVPGQ